MPTDPPATLFDQAVAKRLVSTIFSESHGASGSDLGAGALYYALAIALRSQVSVCIGSGGGFVPRLMRQAQQDLAIENAQTYLIDANLPDLGFGHPMQPGGWLTQGNDLRSEDQGLTVLTMLSADAPQLFASAGVAIDYLHIDGDHSRRGVVRDLSDYLPLLAPGAVVSLHDLRMPSVQQAMADIGQKYPNLEWITFAEIGNGTAILRQRRLELPPLLSTSRNRKAEGTRVTDLAQAVREKSAAESQEKARYERWHYLTSPAYRARYDLIAPAIDLPGHTVIELGGFPNSIVRHLRHAKRVIAIEAYAPPEYLAEIRAAAADREIDLLVMQSTLDRLVLDTVALEPYVFVGLGLDLSGGCDGSEQFRTSLSAAVDLIAGAEVAAIEAPGYMPSQVGLKCLTDCLELEILQDLTLDLSQDPVADEFFVKDERARRRVMVWRPCTALSAEKREPALAKAALFFAELCGEKEQDKSYRFGETIQLVSGSGAGRFLGDGWSRTEQRHTWATGKSSIVELEILHVPGDATAISLRLDQWPFLHGREVTAQRLAVLVNGRRLFKGVLTKSGSIDIPVPRDLLVSRNPVRITLIHPDGARPQDLTGGVSDSRVLSLAVRSLALVNVLAAD